MVGAVIIINSINFWREPYHGCRHADFVGANIGAVIYAWASFRCEYQDGYVTVLIFCLLLFVAAGKLWFMRRKEWVYCHLIFHFLSNLNNILIFTGRQRYHLLHPAVAMHPPIGWKWV